jgi:hypothetical protein
VHPRAHERPVPVRPPPCMAQLEHVAQAATQLSLIQVRAVGMVVYFSIVHA